MEQRDGCGIDSGFSSAIQMLTPVTVSLVGISNTDKKKDNSTSSLKNLKGDLWTL